MLTSWHTRPPEAIAADLHTDLVRGLTERDARARLPSEGGFIQEFKAERSLAALRKLFIATARVVREGIVRAIPARELAPGDLIQIEAGDHVPADARLIYATNLFAQEAALTGESTVVEKSAALLSTESIPLSDQSNLLFLGTVVTAGKGRALVVLTGSRRSWVGLPH
jgi:Ca2+-transporting ATPase